MKVCYMQEVEVIKARNVSSKQTRGKINGVKPYKEEAR